MNEQDKPHSGSRWEPSPRPSSEAPDQQSDPREQPASFSEDPEPGVPDEPARSTGLRGRRTLAAAVGLMAVGAVGGFALVHATAGDDSDRVGLVGNRIPGPDGRAQLPTPPPGFGDGRVPLREHDDDAELHEGGHDSATSPNGPAVEPGDDDAATGPTA